jgi:hypothetical protein
MEITAKEILEKHLKAFDPDFESIEADLDEKATVHILAALKELAELSFEAGVDLSREKILFKSQNGTTAYQKEEFLNALFPQSEKLKEI